RRPAGRSPRRSRARGAPAPAPPPAPRSACPPRRRARSRGRPAPSPAPGREDLVLVRVLGGLGCALAFVAGMRYAALVVEPARVPRALGFYGGFVQLGGGTSLYLVPLLASRLGWRPAFVISS